MGWAMCGTSIEEDGISLGFEDEKFTGNSSKHISFL